MKPKRSIHLFLLGSSLLASLACSLSAATYYFDTNGTTSGFFNGAAGSGAWNGAVYSLSADGTGAITTNLGTASHHIVVGTDTLGFTGTSTFAANKAMQSLTIGAASGDILFDRTSTNGPQALQITNNSTSGNITFDSVIRNNGTTPSHVTQNGGGIMLLTQANT